MTRFSLHSRVCRKSLYAVWQLGRYKTTHCRDTAENDLKHDYVQKRKISSSEQQVEGFRNSIRQDTERRDQAEKEAQVRRAFSKVATAHVIRQMVWSS